MRKDRPTAAESYVTTPLSGGMTTLLGPGMRIRDIVVSREEMRNLNRVYGFREEPPNERPPKPVFVEPDARAWPSDRRRAEEDHKESMKDWENWIDPRTFMQAGADRNMARHAESDGVRLMAWLAKFVPAGEDPLKTLIQLASDAGLDVAPEDNEWAQEEDDGDLRELDGEGEEGAAGAQLEASAGGAPGEAAQGLRDNPPPAGPRRSIRRQVARSQ